MIVNKVIRMENEVPEVYVAKSRDFQVLMRLLSAAFNANRVDIQQLQFLNDARRINERLLPLLQTKIGFFTKKTFTTEELRDVCDIFATDVRDKGAKIGIEEAIRTFFAARNITTDFYIDIKNELPEDVDGEPYSISIGLSQEVGDIDLLEEILRYIIPTGYYLTIFIYQEWDNTEIDDEKKSNYQIAYRNNILYSKPSNYYTSQRFARTKATIRDEQDFKSFEHPLFVESVEEGSFIPKDKYEKGKTYYYFENLSENSTSWYIKLPYGEKKEGSKFITEFYYKRVNFGSDEDFEKVPKSYLYKKVIPEADDNPNDKGWYEYNPWTKTYSLTTDTTVDDSKTYYELLEENPEVNPKEEGWYEKQAENDYILTEDEIADGETTYYIHFAKWYDENALIQGSRPNSVSERRRLSILQTIDTTSIARAGGEEESDK